MDATKITLAPGVTLTRHLGYVDDLAFVPAVTDGLLAWHNLGISLAHAARNWAPGQPDAIVAGAPVVGEGFLSMASLTSYLQSQADDTAQFTWYAVARTGAVFGAGVAQATLPVMISNYQGGPGTIDSGVTSLGSILWWAFNSGNVTGQACRRDGSNAPITGTSSGMVAASVPSEWAAYLMRCTATSLEVRNLTAGISSPVQTFTQARFPGTLKPRIGSARNVMAGVSQIANAVMYSKAQSEPEIAAVYAQIQDYQQRRWGRAV